METVWSGSNLEGSKINGWVEGEARCEMPNGVVYVGQFKGGDFHGKGKQEVRRNRKFIPRLFGLLIRKQEAKHTPSAFSSSRSRSFRNPYFSGWGTLHCRMGGGPRSERSLLLRWWAPIQNNGLVIYYVWWPTHGKRNSRRLRPSNDIFELSSA